MKLKDFRDKYPQYDHLSDGELSRALYDKFYADKMDYDTFFAKVTAEPKPSALTAQNVARGLIKGATLGADKLIAGTTNVLASDAAGITHGKDWKERVQSAGRLVRHITPFGGAVDFLVSPQAKEGRRAYGAQQEEFEEEHPELAFGLEMAGGLASGGVGAGRAGTAAAARTGLKQAVKQGLKAGAGVGGLYGANAGLVKEDGELDPAAAAVQGAASALAGAGLGAAAGAVAPMAARAVKTGKDLVIDAFKGTRAVRELRDAVGQNLVDRSVIYNKPMADFKNKAVGRVMQGAKLNSEEAMDKLGDYAENRLSEQAGRLEDMVKKSVSSKSGAGTAEELLAAKRELSERAYKPLEELGALTKRSRSMAEAIKETPQIKAAIATAKRNVPQLRNLPNSDFRVLNEAKKILDARAQYNPTASGGEKTKIRYAQAARRRLIDEMDAASGGAYKKTLKEYGDVLSAEELVERGRDLFRANPEAFAKEWAAMSELEKEAVKIGLADTLRAEMAALPAEGSTRNIAGRILGSSQRRSILKTVLGKNYGKFINQVREEAGTASQLGKLLNNSNTAEKQSIKGWTSLGGIKKKAINRLDQYLFGGKNERLAELLTDPHALRFDMQKLGRTEKNKLNRLADLLLGDETARQGGSIWGGLEGAHKTAPVEITGLEMGSYAGRLSPTQAAQLRDKTRRHLVDTVRGKQIPVQSTGQIVGVGRGGIGKAINSSADPDKVKMLSALEDIMKNGQPFTEDVKDKALYRYLQTPVMLEEYPRNAVVTLENDTFHNLNDLAYFLWQQKARGADPVHKTGATRATNSIADLLLNFKPSGAAGFAGGKKDADGKKRKG